MSTITLTDRVYAALGGNDQDADAILKVVHERNDRRDEYGLDRFGMDMADWGFVVGIAYAIARGEDPYESGHSVITRATVAATEAWTRWTSVAEDRDAA